VSESLLCYYASYLATDKLSPQTIKVYLAAIWYTLYADHYGPREFSSLPRLRLGIQWTHATQVSTKVRLPITPTILLKLKEHWSPQQKNKDILMIWAAATLGFFRSGKITVLMEKAFDSTKHLAWGGVAVDSTEDPPLLKVHLKRSKSDQLGKGVDVYIGKTSGSLCPVTAILQYMVIRGSKEGIFFQFQDGHPLPNPHSPAV